MGKKKKINLNTMLIVFGIILAVAIIAGVLCGIVISENTNECGNEKLRLGANLFGCTTDSEYVYDNIYFVVGNTANTPVPSLSDEAKKYVIHSSVEKDADIKVFSATSLHNKMKFKNEKISYSRDDVEKLAKLADEKINTLSDAISKPSLASGAEYIDTIMHAGKKLKNRKNEKSLIIVIGSGLSDGGILDFTKGKWDSEPAEVATKKLVEAKQIISDNFENISLYWSGIGSTTQPQEPLGEAEINSLRELYESVLEEIGMTVIDIDESTDNEKSVDTTYLVTPIRVSGPVCTWCEAKDMTSDQIQFIEDTDRFVDESAAKQSINTLIDEMKRNTNERVEITGYVSTKSHNCSIKGIDGNLAQMRANAVKHLLERNGIASERITATSGGKGVRGGDECEGGKYNAERAKSNMYVTIQARI